MKNSFSDARDDAVCKIFSPPDSDPIAYGYGCHLGMRGIGIHELESDWPETLASPDFMRGWRFAYDGIGDEEITAQAEAAEKSYTDGLTFKSFTRSPEVRANKYKF
jgi:hypothetical protein